MNYARTGVLRVVGAWFLIVNAFVVAQTDAAKISEDEIKAYYSKASDCASADDITIDSLEYFDFTANGQEEAVVVASTCATGTAGPDVHTVVARKADGSLEELKIPEITDKEQSALFGRVFYQLTVQNGILVKTYDDETRRKSPLVVKLRWSAQAKQFQPVETKVAPRYKTSFDCDKAQNQVENAICYSSEAAGLDLALNLSYKTWLDNLNDAESDILVKEQKEWLHKRNVICEEDRSVFGCLETLYQARILEVQSFKNLRK